MAEQNIHLNNAFSNMPWFTAVRSAFVFYRWNENGQLGDGTRTNRLTPAPVIGEHANFTSLSAGQAFTCGILAGSQRVACFGCAAQGVL